ncbi:phage tail protein I [Janthinobacterium sp. GW458P]|uniref:phage tail protein I n=1 Tax=Janthinobacterium sp. GW458P TaxID=1981504 RepID=UPI000A328F80|nr:phage tail protein I [Janthinobacterium sp. GW458P]MBE3023062.1 phage tail protein I [Janthinobacterium sp. GW458P]
MNKHVATLPPNTTALERAIAVACAELVNVPVPLRDLWNADRCPVALLPFLAWACSVDRWDDAWPESIKRGTIKAAYFIHKHKGTIAAVRRVVESLGYLIRITEWWQTTPPGTPGTFRLDVGVLDTGITDAMFQEMERLIADAKPVSRHLTGLALYLETRGQVQIGLAAYHGDAMTVYPWIAEKIEVRGTLVQRGAPHTIDTMTIYP